MQATAPAVRTCRGKHGCPTNQPFKNINAIQISKLADVSITIAPEAEAEKLAALKQASGIKSVSDEFSNQLAADALVSLQRLISGTEKGRKIVKEPVLTLGKQIDRLADEFTKPIEAEKKRIGALKGRFDAILIRAAQEAEAKRQEEVRKLEAERLRVEAEERKKQEALQAKLAKLKSDEARAKAEAALKVQQEEAAARRIEAEKRMNELNNAPVVKSVKTEGASSREVWKFEVTNMDVLYLSNYKLVNLEPNTAAINRELAAGVRTIPGLRIYSEIQSVARS